MNSYITFLANSYGDAHAMTKILLVESKASIEIVPVIGNDNNMVYFIFCSGLTRKDLKRLSKRHSPLFVTIGLSKETIRSIQSNR